MGNPGPTGAGAAVYLEGYRREPVLLNQAVSKTSNNYHGELVGIQIALSFLADVDLSRDKNVHMFTDCQSAIRSAFGSEIPKSRISLITQIREMIALVREKVKSLAIHWVPGHVGILGNEIADQQAKIAAKEALHSNETCTQLLDKREANDLIRKKAVAKWNWKTKMSESSTKVQEVFDSVGDRQCKGEDDRFYYSVLNQLISGHNKLNNHMAKIDNTKSALCENCGVREDTDHLIFHCEKFRMQRKKLEEQVEDIIKEEGSRVSVIHMKLLTGNDKDISKHKREDLTMALLQFLRETERFKC